MPKQETVKLRISGMTCEDCARTIEKGLLGEMGIVSATVDLSSKSAEVTFDPGVLSAEGICALPLLRGQYRATCLPLSSEKKPSPQVIRNRVGADGKYDLVILGGGSAAFAAAIKASDMGAKVAIIGEGAMGGTCLNRGCVPTKHLIRAAEIYHLASHNPFSGVTTTSGTVDLAELNDGKNRLVESLRAAKYEGVLEEHGNITFISSRGDFVAPDRLRVESGDLQADRFIIATGASPFVPPIEGVEKVSYLTSDEALELRTLPQSLIVLGANAVGLEFTQVFARFGSKVVVHEIAGRIAPAEEPEISGALQNCLEEEGIEICTCSRVLRAREEDGKKVITSQMPDGRTRDYSADEILLATGRRANTSGIGLEMLGLALGPGGGILVNEKMQTSVPHIYAVGDCVDCQCPAQYVYVAAMQGAVAAHNALNASPPRGMDYRVVPHAIFTVPEVAGVGLTEEQARKQGYNTKTSLLDFHWVPRAVITLEEHGLVKMVAEADTLRILGVNIVGPHAAELIHEAALAVKYGLTAEDIADTLHVYPTLSEALRICAQGFFKDITKLSCCAE